MANPFFNAEYYLANNPDLYLNGVTVETAEAHYIQYGAKEAAAGAAGRDGRPNPWFDATFYMMNNADLVEAGLTVSDALNHYAAYGVNEGRDPNAGLQVADFTAEDYAEANEDVAEALGITDTSDLTPEQTSQLLSHYFAYGYIEGRDGAGINAGSADIIVIANNPTFGTTGNDTFAWNDTVLDATVNGLAGTDTLKAVVDASATIKLNSVEKIAVTSSAAATLTVLGSGVQSVSVDNTGIFTYDGAKVDSFDLAGTDAVIAEFTSGVAGTADVLAVNVADEINSALTVNGIETVNVQLGASDGPAISALNLTVNSVQGSSLTVTVAGGVADEDSGVVLNSEASPDLANVTLDGSAGVGNQTLSIEDSLELVNATITGGAGDDSLSTLTAEGQVATLNGGAGDDTLVASEGQDIMTGGADLDTFEFTAATAFAQIDEDGQITSVDTIQDFTAGHEDVLTLSGVVATAVAAGTGVTGFTDGVVQFKSGWSAGKDLTAIVTELDLAVASGEKAAFDFGGDSYVFVSGVAADITDDAVIKLAGVATSSLTIDATGVNFG